MSTVMTLGDYNFTPVPLMRLGLTPNKNGAGEIFGFTWSMNLSGDLIVQSGTSIVQIDAMQDDLAEAVASGNGQHFLLICGDPPETLLECYPRIVGGPTFEAGQWVNRSPYTIDMEFDILLSGGPIQYISDYNEEWSFEFAEEKTQFHWGPINGDTEYLPFTGKLTHGLSATGKSVYDSGGLVQTAFSQAKAFVISRLGEDNEFIENSGVINLSAANFGLFNHYRSINANESTGVYGVNETWLLMANDIIPSGSGDSLIGNATEDFTISIKKGIESRFYEVTIDGTIQGLETRDYGSSPGDFEITEQRYDAAVNYWNNAEGRLYSRGQLVLNNTYSSPTRNLNIAPLNETMSHNPYLGTIQYGRTYNDRPSNCLTGASTESISISDNNGGDVFASIFVLGRGSRGPVLQDLSARKERTRTLTLEAIMEPSGICPSSSAAVINLISSCKPINADDVVENVRLSLTGPSGTYPVFTDSDNEEYDLKNGRYHRTVTWTHGQC